MLDRHASCSTERTMRTMSRTLAIILLVGSLGCVAESRDGERSASSENRSVLLDLVYGGSAGTIVFIHGHHGCVGGDGADTQCSATASGYWTNAHEDGGDDRSLIDDASSTVD